MHCISLENARHIQQTLVWLRNDWTERHFIQHTYSSNMEVYKGTPTLLIPPKPENLQCLKR